MFLEHSVLSFSLFLLLYEKRFWIFFSKFGIIIIIKEKHFSYFVTIKSHLLCVFEVRDSFLSDWTLEILFMSFSPKSILIRQVNLSFLLWSKSKTKKIIHWHLENRYVENSNNRLIRWMMTDKVQTRQNQKLKCIQKNLLIRTSFPLR